MEQEEAQKIIDMDEVIDEAVRLAEHSGIVFIDEIDKIAERKWHMARMCQEKEYSVILPIVEGTAR